jgi:hypothetical protein
MAGSDNPEQLAGRCASKEIIHSHRDSTLERPDRKAALGGV